MGKRLIQQRRGKGSLTYKSPSFKYKGKVSYYKFNKKKKISGKIVDLVKCAGHSAPLAEIEFEDGEKRMMIAPEGVKVGDNIQTGPESDPKTGNVTNLENIPEGAAIYNIESNPGDGGKFVRSSGTSAKIVSKSKSEVRVLLPSGKKKIFNPKCRASVGIIAGGGRLEKPILKAGKNYHAKKSKNKLYPKVSGVAMNAVDHPFGGTTSSHKGTPDSVSRNAPPGRKVGSISPKRKGYKR